MKKGRFNLFRDFFESEQSSGLLLVAITIISITIANTALGEGYLHFWHTYLDLSIPGLNLKYSIEHWINDGLMTIFFLLVGLEIEREIYVGELSNFRNALLPMMAAIGGMLIPALLHFSLNAGTATQAGYGIPMATDIAFALGILSLAGNKVPTSLKVFLTALAIIDDLGAVIIIALFYTSTISAGYLFGAFGIFAVLLIMNRLKVNKLSLYLIPGLAMWYCMLQSGVHATISGVLLAFAIPFQGDDDSNISYRLQHWLHKPVAFLIIPLFALANTAIIVPEDILAGLTTRNSLGIFSGLLAGKFLGVLLFSYLCVRLGISSLPADVRWKHLAGAALLAGIGFTMSIFITNLAFSDPTIITNSKLAILCASVIAALAGLAVLRMMKADTPQAS